jgi:DNA-directed RNA polymerase II subunit RPB1
MSFLQKSFNEELTENVYEVILGICNPEDIEKGSVCEVLTSETYENNLPKTNGLFDLRMGTIEQGLNCETCFQDQRGCGGHFGHIKLVRPLYHMQFINILMKIAKCFCYACSECLIDEEKKKELRKKLMKSRFNIAYKECKDKQNPICNKCYTLQPMKYVNPKGSQDTKIIAKIYGEFVETIGGEKRNESRYFPCEQMLEFLKRIRNDDLDTIGIPSKTSRPDWMICSVFPVPPPHVRPSVRQENNQKSEDDLTHKLAEIINHNQTVRKEMENNNLQHIEDWTQLLQYHVATFVDNEIPGIPKAMQRSGRPIKSLKQRLQAKDGRMRYNLMGKRGDFTARTVITPDPNIELDEIGIPLKIARNLTIPIQVTENNIDTLREYYNNGTDIYPGAKRLERGNKNYSLDGKRFKEQIGDLRIKDILHRNLLNGDYVLFNRQPSLHKMSMMGHRIRVLPVGNTFRMNVSATSPYNADFDGDEMNVFLTQCMEGMCELKFLASVPNQIISPQKNAPVIGLVQDTLYVCPQITNEKVIIPRDIWMNLSLYLEKEQLPLPNEFTGRKIFETILPKINIEKDTNLSEFTGNINDKLKIEDGIIKRGSLDKKVVGSSHGGFIHLLWKDKGPNESKKFIYNCQKLCNQWLLNQGHSIGVSDVVLIKPIQQNSNQYKLDTNTYSEMEQIIDNAIYEVDYLLEKAGQGFYDTRSTLSVEDDIEKEILFVLNKARDNVGKIAIKHALEHNPDNRLLKMVLSGSKGDKSGVYQIMATMGEAQVGADRTPKKFYRRVLPHFVKDDNSARSRGFCKSSFKEGMKPLELYQLGISARIGLIDKTVKTADTGYTQRRLIKSMEDLQVQYDLSVRSANNSILQFIYGDDGFDATFLEIVGFKYHLMKDDELKLNSDEKINLELLRKCLKNVDSIVVPFNLERLFVEFKNENNVSTKSTKKITINDIIQLREQLITKINNYHKLDLLNDNLKSLISDPFFIVKSYIQLYWRNSEINNKLSKYNDITFEQYQKYFNKLYDMFIMALAAAGEMVGILSGQSIGEPTTQLTLNTFHHTGIGGKSPTTSGVPRMKELLGVVKEPKTPVMSLYIQYYNKQLKQIVNMPVEYKDKEYENIRKFSFLFNEIYIQDLVDNTEIIFTNNWTLNIEFPIAKLMRNNIDTKFLIKKIIESNLLENNLMEFDLTEKSFILKIIIDNEYLKSSGALNKVNGIYHKIKLLENDILQILINGVVNVKSTYISTINKEMFIQTSGSNLDDVLSKKWEFDIDDTYKIILNKSRCRSNNIHEMYNCFGIEVARNSLIEEFSEVLESTGSINHRHITILVDNMTSKGMLIPIDRHGVKKNDIGPLSRATFEETVDQLMKAAAFGEEDTMRGVSANIMMGQIAPCGTGVMDVMLDEEKLFTFNIKNINKSNQNDINDDIIPEDKIGNCFKQLTTYKYPFDKIQTPVELPLMNDKYIQNLENKFK